MHTYKSEEDRIFFSAWASPIVDKPVVRIPFDIRKVEDPAPELGPYSIAHHFKPFDTIIPEGEQPYVESREHALRSGDYAQADHIDEQHRDFLKQEYAKKPKWVPRALPGTKA